MMGSIFEFLRFEHPDELEQFISSVRGNKLADDVADKNPLKSMLISLSRAQSTLVSGFTRNSPHAEGSELVKVRLPPTFVRRIDLYAKLTRSSRSAILTRLFERGLLLSLRSERAFMKAMTEATQGNGKTLNEDQGARFDQMNDRSRSVKNHHSHSGTIRQPVWGRLGLENRTRSMLSS
jgi:hypothetical protein